MLIVRLQSGVTYTLEKSVGNAGKHGIWEFHRSANSYMRPPDYTPFRHAAILPAEPADGQSVSLSICKPGMPEEQWIEAGEGTATYDSDR
ncbi:hypothetical protein MHL40_15545 [Pseudomonas luteola]|uniref:hypothetical protein n=1 Tax=Pseudomonas luteola TaxID=47886 RepID=UPI001EF630ED|nr:hypothetical protein [Pseudomonas luteola]MCG7374072.1 hypothetical protein [Pseudomonas luteola]